MKNNFSEMLNSSYLLPEKNYETFYIKKLSDLEKNPITKIDPFFYDQIYDIPIINDFLNNFNDVEKEILNFCQSEQLYDFPRFEIKNNVYMYDNKWEVAPISKLTDDDYRLDQDMLDIEKNNYVIKNSESFTYNQKIKISVEDILSDGPGKYNLINFVKMKCPIVNNIISDLEKKDILQNSYISKIYPGCIIRPHIDKHINLLRFHLGIQEDLKCTLTVGKETRPWEKGKFLAFNHCGQHFHSVNHTGNIPRISLAFDLSMEYVSQFLEI